MTGPVFVIAVLTLTVVEPVVDPLMTKIAIRSVPARRGGVAPVSTLVGLLITAWISSGMQITRANTSCWPPSSGWLPCSPT
jgi:hypothetical protein